MHAQASGTQFCPWHSAAVHLMAVVGMQREYLKRSRSYSAWVEALEGECGGGSGGALESCIPGFKLASFCKENIKETDG
eukprot:1161093-Pelagomonas_calceolata.AAC.3